MYITYIVKRTQIYLDEELDRRLAEAARAQGVTKSHLIRTAVDAYLDGPDEDEARLKRFRAALDKAFGIAPYLPDGKTYVENLRRVDAENWQELDRRWHGETES